MGELTRSVVEAEHYVARYVRGGLSDAERDAFEEFCLMNPETAHDVAADRALLSGLKRAQDPGRIRRRVGIHPLALAAGIAILVVGGVYLFWRGQSTPLLQVHAGIDPSIHGQILRVNLMTLRNPGVQRVELSPEQRFVELRVYPDPIAPTHEYTVSVSGTVGDRIVAAATLDRLTPDTNDDDALVLVVGTAKREDAELQIKISGPHGEAGEFKLQITHRP